MIDRLPEDTQTLYAELLALLLAREAERDWSHLSGTFTTKTVKGVAYAYFQYSDPGGAKRQFAVGRAGPELDALVAAYRRGEGAGARDREEIARLAQLLRAAGSATIAHAPARVLRGLADAGLFANGAVLVGSYGFLAISNLLGVRWPPTAWRTQDIDIAAQLLLAVPRSESDVPKALDALQMGFVPVPQLDAEHPSTSFRIRGATLRVDLITPGGERDSAPIFLPRLRASAAPVKYLSLLLRATHPAIVTDGTMACLVAVPDPARFALHKLLVSQMRPLVQQTKGGKDLHQAALLLEVLAVDRPDDLEVAARSFAESGPAVTRKIHRGLERVRERWPEAGDACALLAPHLRD